MAQTPANSPQVNVEDENPSPDSTNPQLNANITTSPATNESTPQFVRDLLNYTISPNTSTSVELPNAQDPNYSRDSQDSYDYNQVPFNWE